MSLGAGASKVSGQPKPNQLFLSYITGYQYLTEYQQYALSKGIFKPQAAIHLFLFLFQTEDGQFKLSFTYRFPDQRNGVCYFAFCYPYSYSESQAKLEELDHNFSSCQQMSSSSPKDDIYYHRELLCYSLDNLRVDLLTITSAKGILESREDWLPSLFPEKTVPRAHRFQGKKVSM